MKYAGIDYGAKRVGVAISDEAGTIAFPRTVLSNDHDLVARIVDIVRVEKVESIVIGDTLSHGGAHNPVSDKMAHFVSLLKKEAGVPVIPMWELWSSVEASRYAPERKQHDDAAAAAVILQRYLDIYSHRVE